MARNLLLITGGVDFTKPRSSWKLVQAIALEDTGYASSRDLDVMVTRQVPDDAHWPQVVGLAEVKHLLDDLRRRSVLRVLRDRLLPNEGSLTMLLERRLPTIVTKTI